MADTWEDIRIIPHNPASKPYAKTIVNSEYIIYIDLARADKTRTKESLTNLVLEESVKRLGKNYPIRKIRVHIDERITEQQYNILYQNAGIIDSQF